MTRSQVSPDQHKVSMAVETLKKSGSLRFAARGYSMLPSLWPGDVLRVQAEPGEQFAIGDVVLYVQDDHLFAHRVLRRVKISGKDCVVVRGDSMPRADRPVAASEVLGKVTAVERDGRALAGIPRCTLLVRALGLALCWDRSRSVVLRLRAGRRVRNGAASTEQFSI